VTESKTFFQHQRLARGNTRKMVILFALAVVAVVLAVDLVLAAGWLWGMNEFQAPYASHGPGASFAAMMKAVPASLFVWGALGTLGVILGASLAKIFRLREGGEAIARMAGARLVAQNASDPLERRLLNVVEEMAIASGVRVPKVYIMDGEAGINAFAAGYDVSNAVVAVTRGTLQALNRDELQGMIGHEFSHILNGDMWLNIKMMGTLAGIVFIGALGEFVMRSAGGSRSSKDSSSSGLLALGLALFVVGYAGLFFARLIKAAVSREREFLADASSVQFTRNPDGIAGALDQIRSLAAGSLISGRHAEEMSHMFFGQSIKMRLTGLLDTHPPLEERIRRVNPRFQPSSYRQARPAVAPEGGAAAAAGTLEKGTAGFAGTASQTGRRAGDLGTAWGRSAGASAGLVGTMDAGKIDYAARLLASLPQALRESLREPDGARAALISLLLAPAADVMEQQLLALKAAGLGALGEQARGAAEHTRKLGPAFRLPVIDLALPALKSAPEAAKKELIAALEAVIYADRRVSLHEFVVLTLVRGQLAPKTKPGAAAGAKLAELQAEAQTVLALMAHAGTRADATGARQAELQAALRAGAKEMGIAGRDTVDAAATIPLEAAAGALEALKRLEPLQKELLIKGLFAAATADGRIRVAEAELMRLVGAVLECPLPPLLQELDPATLAA
jgi:Zn-dependent protease with chaperone function